MRPFSLRWLDLTLPDPDVNIRLDEDLLQEGAGVFRVWESPQVCVVLGQSCRAERDVHLAECSERGVPVIRRCSGGGAVLIGPGCLNYTLVLRFEWNPEWRRVQAAMRWVMDGMRSALGLPELKIEGLCDLAVRGFKVSGNAQRRTTDTFLHHGTLLYNFDTRRVTQLLKEPARQPAYRAGRAHSEFLGNLPLGVEELKLRLARAWC